MFDLGFFLHFHKVSTRLMTSDSAFAHTHNTYPYYSHHYRVRTPYYGIHIQKVLAPWSQSTSVRFRGDGPVSRSEILPSARLSDSSSTE